MKNKAFTLIELLAVIVVLGIIMLIAVTSVSSVITKSRLSSFSTSSKMLEKAASTYINASNTIIATGTTTTILYSDLKTGGYMNQIIDPLTKNECTNSRVYVTNVSGTYTYKGALVCDNYMDIDSYNLLTNSDFSNGTTGWNQVGATNSLSGGILYSTGDGTSASIQVSQTIPSLAMLNHKYYLKSKVRVTNSNTTNLQVLFSNGTQYPNINVQATPTQNQWYTMSGIGTFTSGAGTTLYVYAGTVSYADAATANGKVMQVDGTRGIYAFDLTAIYGAGNEPTLAQMDKIMSNMGKW